MPKKISPFKVSKIIAYYLNGYSQPEIASKLKIDQSTVSKQISKFKEYAEQYGTINAVEEYGVMNIFDALHDLAVDLQNNHLTVEEAAVGLKMVIHFEKLGIKEKDYQDVIQAATKMKTGGFLSSAVELQKLEQSTGMTHNEIVDKTIKTNQQLTQNQAQLHEVTGKLGTVKNDLADVENKKKLATKDLEEHMKQVGVDTNRLKKVENLAVALKKGGIPDDELEGYIKRQQMLNEAGISVEILASILEKAAVATSKDHGEALFQALEEYGGLNETNQALQSRIESLKKEASGLEKQAQLKGEIEAEIFALKAEKASLEPHVSELHAQKDQLEKVQSDVDSFTRKRDELAKGTADMEKYKTALDKDIKSREKKVSNLEKLEKRHDAVSTSLAEIKHKQWEEGMRWKMFENFLGFVGSSSIDELKKFERDFHYFIGEAKEGNYPTQALRNMMYQKLMGEKLNLQLCHNCNIRFGVDKLPPPYQSLKCPICGFAASVRIDEVGLKELEEIIAATKPKILVAKLIDTGLNAKQKKDKDNK